MYKYQLCLYRQDSMVVEFSRKQQLNQSKKVVVNCSRYERSGSREIWGKWKLLICLGCFWLLARGSSEAKEKKHVLQLIVTDNTASVQHKLAIEAIKKQTHQHIMIENKLTSRASQKDRTYLRKMVMQALDSPACWLLTLSGFSADLHEGTKPTPIYKKLMRIIRENHKRISAGDDHNKLADLPDINIEIQNCSMPFIVAVCHAVVDKRVLLGLDFKDCEAIHGIDWIHLLPWSSKADCIFSITNSQVTGNIQTNLKHLAQATLAHPSLSVFVDDIGWGTIGAVAPKDAPLNLLRVTLRVDFKLIFDLIKAGQKIVGLERLTILGLDKWECEDCIKDQLKSLKQSNSPWQIRCPVVVQLPKYYCERPNREADLSEFITCLGVTDNASKVVFTYQDWTNIMVLELFKLPNSAKAPNSSARNSIAHRVNFMAMTQDPLIMRRLAHYYTHFDKIPKAKYTNIEIVGGEMLQLNHIEMISAYCDILNALLDLCAFIQVEQAVISGTTEPAPSGQSLTSTALLNSKPPSSCPTHSSKSATANSRADRLLARPLPQLKMTKFGTLDFVGISNELIYMLIDDLLRPTYFQTINIIDVPKINTTQLARLLEDNKGLGIRLIKVHLNDKHTLDLRPAHSAQANPMPAQSNVQAHQDSAQVTPTTPS
ncbi:hypothetical protein NEHOM01_0567 [Nematocida homosporus]|uniref:uncharacterized protein n=1 Tax=Nematocida homosporus TaxID=1912981 RepID=UPI002220E2BA|nr:uncharacterized protein NEHOM01_0567 [Nematocida homosporus]KAI5185062.1 hypothetical protein NEHOM01_0567 [Nematocida homosporus]